MEVKCKKCGYEWNYSGDLIKATCPSCGNKVQVKKVEM